jgi:hypothetical protein
MPVPVPGSGGSLEPPKRTAKLTVNSKDEQLAAKLAAKKSELERCYDRGLARDPSLRGQIVADVRIEASGEIGEIALIEQLTDRDVSKCIVQEIDGWKLGARKGSRGVVARVTIELAPY